ncbi:Mobile element protein [hydrothermal vent metagenome]|uniref:Mobile element protein n=1 Tax=hydrothermal vent metagenome TaxID=652676 RepID=A0A3B0ZK20_9ZZZZ
MKKEELQAFAQEAAKNIKTEADLTEFRQMLTKITVEAALNAELDEHLGYSKHEKAKADNQPQWLLQ